MVELLPCITSIVNKSLQSGVFPDCLKRAFVTPLLKKTGLDVEEMKNFRPVSNLPFLGKIIERAAISQFQSYMMNNDLYSKNQSAYRKSHSVETALVKVNNDLLQAVDNHGEAVLVLLDMSRHSTPSTTRSCCADYRTDTVSMVQPINGFLHIWTIDSNL